MDDEMYRAGGNDPRNLPTVSANYRRQLLTDIRAFDAKHQIPISQQSKHTIPNWVLILACLPPNDTNESRTLEEIHSIITDLEYPIRQESVRNAFMPMVSRNPKKRAEMSKIVRDAINRVGGIRGCRVVEDGKCCGSYTLGIGLVKLQELVDKKEFTTYSFNLNDNLAIKLVGGI